MDSFYSILYFKPNPMTDEVITLGVIGGGGEGPFIFISDNRVRFLKSTVHNNTYLGLKRNLKSLEKSVNSYRNSNRELLLFDPIYTAQVFDKLSKKHNQSLMYSKPVAINDFMNEGLFNEFVLLILGEKVTNRKKVTTKPFHIQWKNKSKAKRFNHLQKNITANQLNDEINPMTFGSSVKIEMYDAETSTIYKPLDFDISEKKLRLKVSDVKFLLKNTDKNIVLLSPTIRTRLGKELRDELITEKRVEVLSLNQLMNRFESQVSP